MKYLSTLLCWLGWFVLLLLTLLFIVVVRNQFDDELTPETQRWLLAPATTNAPADNAFAYLYGITAAENKDPQTVGKQWLEKQQAATLELPLKTTTVKCPAKDKPCLDYILAHRQQIRQAIDENLLLYQRYQILLSKTTFEEIPLPRDAYIENEMHLYVSLGTVAKLYRMQLVLELVDGVSDADQRMARQMAAWLLMLHHSHTMIGTLTAAANLKWQVDLIKELQRHYPDRLGIALHDEVKALANLDASQLFRQLLQGDFLSTAYVFPQYQHPEEHDWTTILYLRNASLNLLQQRMAKLAEGPISPCDPAEVVSWINPAGKTLVCIVDLGRDESYRKRLQQLQQDSATLLHDLEFHS